MHLEVHAYILRLACRCIVASQLLITIIQAITKKKEDFLKSELEFLQQKDYDCDIHL